MTMLSKVASVICSDIGKLLLFMLHLQLVSACEDNSPAISRHEH